MQASTDILYIEDNEDYIEFVKRAITKVDTGLRFSVLMDGKDTLKYIDAVNTEATLPKLILLDINLPDYNGIELLTRIRANRNTRYVPVIMLSSSENPLDVRKSLDGGANAYLVKPMGLTPLTETIQSLCSFWLNHHPNVESFAA